MAKQGFTDPKLYDYDGDMGKDWYVGFRHTNPATGIRKPFQLRGGINYHKTESDRRAEGKAYVKMIEKALNADWNPHAEELKDFIVRTTKPEQQITRMSLNAALDLAFNNKIPNLSGKSKSDIEGVLKFAKSAAEKISIHNMPIVEVERPHIKMLLDQMGKDRQAEYDKQGKGKKWTGNSYNKYREFLCILFTELEEFNAVKYNPCLRISKKPEIKTNIHRHATQEEDRLIKDKLRKDDPDFLVYLAFEYLTGLRPKELFSLKIESWDKINQCFDLSHDDGKTRTSRKVPIPNTLLPFLQKMKLSDYPTNYYIFSNDFRPGEYKIRGGDRADYATKRWKKLIKDELGINVSLYSYKGKGGEDKRNAGIGLFTVAKGSFGHADTDMAMKHYLPGEQDRINAEIREKTPEFI